MKAMAHRGLLPWQDATTYLQAPHLGHRDEAVGLCRSIPITHPNFSIASDTDPLGNCAVHAAVYLPSSTILPPCYSGLQIVPVFLSDCFGQN